MTGDPTQRLDVMAPAHGAGADLSNVTPLAAERGEASSAPTISVTNVVPFVRPRREAAATSASDVALDPADRPAPHLIGRERRAQIAALFALSLAVHYGLYALFNREPQPMASIGLEAISVEIVLGANMPAGLAPTPGEQQVQSAPADDPKPNPIEPDTTIAKAEETPPAEAKPVQEPQRLAPTAVPEASPERPQSQAAEAPPERLEQQQVAVLRAEETPAPGEPDATVTPAEPARPEPARPEPVETKPEPAPKQDATRKREMQPTRERTGPSQKTASREPNPTGPRSSAASGVGLGRSQRDTNYHGVVAAHLARHKRFPPEARSRGEQGGATVSFALDGSGRVTRVSLVRGTGSAILDQEATAMVRRASPFPAPPDGRSANFTVPVSFRIQ
jgi:protein TonB